jgi:hypothetical protein
LDVLETLDSLQSAAEKDEAKKQEVSKKPEYHFDKLKMYFGEDYTINGITISIPTIGDILNIGESKFYQAISPFLSNSTSIRVLLVKSIVLLFYLLPFQPLDEHSSSLE